jgi:hypothetical protein
MAELNSLWIYGPFYGEFVGWWLIDETVDHLVEEMNS